MRWKRRSINTKDEEQIITGMIVSTHFLREILPILKPELLGTPYARTVASWCRSYFEEYEEAPGPTIQDIYATYVGNGLDDSQSELIANFLSGLSNEYERGQKLYNTPYMLDKAGDYLQGRALKNLVNSVRSALADDNIEEASLLISSFHQLERHKSTGIRLLSDSAWARSVLDGDYKAHHLFMFPGDLGAFLGNYGREHLIAFAAPVKRGKTWWLQEVAMRSIYRKLNVVFFSLEMSKEEMTMRMMKWLCAKPWPGERKAYYDYEEKTILRPVFDCLLNQENDCELDWRTSSVGLLDEDDNIPIFEDADNEYVPCDKCRKMSNEKYRRKYIPETWWRLEKKEELTKEETYKMMERARRKFGDRLRLFAFPANSVSVQGLRTHLDLLETTQGFIADVVVVDYADNMISGRALGETRHEINAIWKGLKGLSQEKSILVVTATHTKIRTLHGRIREGDSSEDIRKEAEVDALIALNQTPQDKAKGLMRISVTADRHEGYDVRQEVWVLENRGIGKPYLDSHIPRYINNSGKEKIK